MRTEKFKKWLLEERALNFRSAQSRISNCRTVERTYSDLDKQFLKDEGQSLMELLTYSTENQRNRSPAKHLITINGNIKNGSDTLKSAVVLYMKFCKFERENGKHSDMQPKLDLQVPELKSEKSLEVHHSIIKNNQTNISYKKLFGDFLEGATEYVVRDPYIRFHYQLKNFNKLCHLIGETKHNGERLRIHLITNKNDEFLENTKKSFEKMISSLSNQGIELSYEFSDILHDRSIEMNNGWKIVLGRGLDIWQKYGSFDEAEDDQEKRLCKEFEITIVKMTIPNLIKQELISEHDGELKDAVMDELEIEIRNKSLINNSYSDPNTNESANTSIQITNKYKLIPPQKPNLELIDKRIENGMKIGEYVKYNIIKLFEEHLLTNDEIQNLQKKDFCKQVFNQNYEVLRNRNREIKDEFGHNRYYAKELFCGNYFLTSQWFEGSRDPFKTWLKKIRDQKK